MKRRLTLWAAGVVLLAAALSLVVFHARPGSAQPGAPPASPRVAAPAPDPQRHPRVEAAIRHLEAARSELEAAPNIFHGHREAAIKRINEAIGECNRALESVR